MLNKYLELYADKNGAVSPATPSQRVLYILYVSRIISFYVSLCACVFLKYSGAATYIPLLPILWGGWWLHLTCNVLTWSCNKADKYAAYGNQLPYKVSRPPREPSLYKKNTSYNKLLLADGIFHLLILRKPLPVPTVVSRDPEHNWCSGVRLFYSNASEVGTPVAQSV